MFFFRKLGSLGESCCASSWPSPCAALAHPPASPPTSPARSLATVAPLPPTTHARKTMPLRSGRENEAQTGTAPIRCPLSPPAEPQSPCLEGLQAHCTEETQRYQQAAMSPKSGSLNQPDFSFLTPPRRDSLNCCLESLSRMRWPG